MKWIVFLCLLAVYSVQAMPSQEEEEQAVESNNEEEEGVDGVKSRNKRSYRVDDGPHPEPSGLDLDVNVNVNVPGSNNDVDVNVNVNAGYINWDNGPSNGEDSESEAAAEERSTEGSISNSSDWSGGDGSGAECSTSSRNGCDTVSAADCVWDQAKYVSKIAPLLLNSSFQMVLPIREGNKNIFRVPAGTELTIACPGGKIKALDLEGVKGTCVGNKLINVNGTNWTMAKLGCSDKVQSSIKPDTHKCGHPEIGVYLIIGFNIAITDQFFEVIRVCFDRKQETTIYTKNTIHGANIAAKVRGYDRPSSFKTGDFSVPMTKLYKVESQEERIKKLFPVLAEKIINESDKMVFNKGHLAPVADFVTKAERDATFYFINAVPQWETFNMGNWKQLENSTCWLAKKLHTDLTIYTGTFNVLKLKNNNSVLVDIYLGIDVEKPVVPAPELMWKVVHDETAKQAVALVGVNNPHSTSAPTPLCETIDCASIKWLKSTRFNVTVRGYTYCCTVDNLREKIPNIPKLGKVTLLDKIPEELTPGMESLG